MRLFVPSDQNSTKQVYGYTSAIIIALNDLGIKDYFFDVYEPATIHFIFKPTHYRYLFHKSHADIKMLAKSVSSYGCLSFADTDMLIIQTIESLQ